MNRSLRTFIANVAYSPIGNKLISMVGGNSLYAVYKVRSIKKQYFKSAARIFRNEQALGNLDDFKKALDKHWVSYNEYACQYEFYNKTEKERNEFVSRLKMCYYHWKYTDGTTKAVFRNKQRFLKVFKEYVHREWLYAPDSSFESFVQLISSYDCIVKPCDGKLGIGVFKVKKNDVNNDIRGLFDFCVKNRMLVEQCIESCKELKVFHPESLNTIRVVTIANKEHAEVFGSFLRMGVGNSVVDNAHAGGVFAQINIKKGTIESNGIDTNGNIYVSHPDSNIKLKGYSIPQWEAIVYNCCKAARLLGNTLMGWDVAINNRGEIEFVEANYGPDFDVMQSPLKIGVKKRLYSLIKEYSGVEMD